MPNPPPSAPSDPFAAIPAPFPPPPPLPPTLPGLIAPNGEHIPYGPLPREATDPARIEAANAQALRVQAQQQALRAQEERLYDARLNTKPRALPYDRAGRPHPTLLSSADLFSASGLLETSQTTKGLSFNHIREVAFRLSKAARTRKLQDAEVDYLIRCLKLLDLWEETWRPVAFSREKLRGIELP